MAVAAHAGCGAVEYGGLAVTWTLRGSFSLFKLWVLWVLWLLKLFFLLSMFDCSVFLCDACLID